MKEKDNESDVGGIPKPPLLSEKFMEMINDDSPLLRLPQGLRPKQRLILEGTRYSAQTVELAFQRLYACLHELSLKNEEPERAHFIKAFADAWTIVDATNRLRQLLWGLPDAKESLEIKNFRQETNAVKDLRDGIQHLTGRAERLVSDEQSPWGSLTWVSQDPTESNSYFTHSLIAGALTGKQRFENVAGKLFMAPLDLIALRAHTNKVMLIPLLRDVRSVIRFLEQTLQDQVSGHKHPPSDLYFALKFSVSDNGQK